MLARAVFVFAVTGLFHLAGRRTWPWPMTTVVAWSGMRGVVTLAAAFLLPEQTPGRDLLRLAAFAVVAGTLLAQGLSLPWLVRRLGLRGPDRSEDAMAAATLVDRATRAGLHRLDDLLVGNEPPQVVEALRSRSEAASDSAWERLGRPEAGQATPTGTYRRLRLAMLSAERDTIVAARDAGTAADDVLRRALAVVDVEESMLDHGDAEADAAERDDDLGAGTDPDEACGHLRAAPTDVVFDRPDVCPDCLREGTTWVHLRGCLTCANVGCCDSSVGRHATRHFTTTRHPVMRSVEPGEAWRWCYLDEQVG